MHRSFWDGKNYSNASRINYAHGPSRSRIVVLLLLFLLRWIRPAKRHESHVRAGPGLEKEPGYPLFLSFASPGRPSRLHLIGHLSKWMLDTFNNIKRPLAPIEKEVRRRGGRRAEVKWIMPPQSTVRDNHKLMPGTQSGQLKISYQFTRRKESKRAATIARKRPAIGSVLAAVLLVSIERSWIYDPVK